MGLLDVGGKALQYLPAAIGAYQAGSAAAEQGQNPLQVLGATALGGTLGLGLGHYGGKFGRMAGEKLAGTKVGQDLLGQGSSAMAKFGSLTKLPGPVAPLTVAGVGGLTALGGGLIGSALPAGAIAAGTTGLVGNATRAVVGPAATFGAIQQPGTMAPNAAVPPDIAAKNRPMNDWDILAGPAATARHNEWLQSEQERAQAVKMAQAMYPIMSQAKKDEMQRNLAAAQIRANIATNSQLMLGGAQTAQQMGLNAASQMGSALAAQYQYG